ncbi:unnamed protein product, partial [Ixodes hexagonus]
MKIWVIAKNAVVFSHGSRTFSTAITLHTLNQIPSRTKVPVKIWMTPSRKQVAVQIMERQVQSPIKALQTSLTVPDKNAQHGITLLKPFPCTQREYQLCAMGWLKHARHRINQKQN